MLNLLMTHRALIIYAAAFKLGARQSALVVAAYAQLWDRLAG
jgi:hypothetical protein